MTGSAGVRQAWRSFWRAQSLRRRLLTLLLPSLVLITLVELTLSYRLAQQTIDEAYDRGLKGAVQALSLATSMDDSGFSVDRPFKLLSYVQSNSRGTVFFHVRTSDGLMEAGFAGLDFPWPGAVMPDTVYLAEGLYFDQNLRMAAMRREVNPQRRRPRIGRHPHLCGFAGRRRSGAAPGLPAQLSAARGRA